MKPAAALFVLAGLFVLSVGEASAQTDFSGTWALDRDISADLSKASFEPPPPPKRRSPGGLSGGFGPFRFGGRGGGRGAGPERPAGGSESGGGDGHGAAVLTVDERARLRDLADYVKTLAPVMTIEHSDHSTFTVTDGRGRSHLFPTDATKTTQALATTSTDAVTTWDGPHMVTVYTIGPSSNLVFTYILVPATRQMALRIQLEEAGRSRADVPELKLVYKLTSAPKAPADPSH